MLKTGYIVGPRSDAVWFLALPAIALTIGLACQEWLSAVAITSVALLITGPHHFVTLFRTYGLAEDRSRFADRLLVGAIVITALTAAGYYLAPLSLVLLTVMWNHQHTMMQIHGISRIYDFKAKAGAASTGQWDFWLNAVVYGGLVLLIPPYVEFWMRELHRFGVPITAGVVQSLQTMAWGIVLLGSTAYLGHHVWLARKGHGVNPLKLVFLTSSYTALFAAGFHTASILIFQITAQIIHGVQYIVIVYYFVRRKTEESGSDRFLSFFVKPGNVFVFLLMCGAYAVCMQLIGQRPLDELTFGLVTSISSEYPAIPQASVGAMSPETGYAAIATVIVSVPGLLHLYYDSFIWKVRDRRIHGGL